MFKFDDDRDEAQGNSTLHTLPGQPRVRVNESQMKLNPLDDEVQDTKSEADISSIDLNIIASAKQFMTEAVGPKTGQGKFDINSGRSCSSSLSLNDKQ